DVAHAKEIDLPTGRNGRGAERAVGVARPLAWPRRRCRRGWSVAGPVRSPDARMRSCRRGPRTLRPLRCDQIGEGLDDLDGVVGLRHVHAEARVEGLLPVLLERVRGDGHGEDRGQGRPLANGAEEIVAIDAGEADVEQEQVGVPRAVGVVQGLEGLLGARRGVDAGASGLEQHGQELRVVGVVIHEHDGHTGEPRVNHWRKLYRAGGSPARNSARGATAETRLTSGRYRARSERSDDQPRRGLTPSTSVAMTTRTSVGCSLANRTAWSL